MHLWGKINKKKKKLIKILGSVLFFKGQAGLETQNLFHSALQFGRKKYSAT